MPLPCCLIGGTAPRANTRKLEGFSVDCCVVCANRVFFVLSGGVFTTVKMYKADYGRRTISHGWTKGTTQTLYD